MYEITYINHVIIISPLLFYYGMYFNIPSFNLFFILLKYRLLKSYPRNEILIFVIVIRSFISGLLFLFLLIYSSCLFSVVAICTVDYVRSKIATLLTDADISEIITETGSDVLVMCETTSETNPTVILAGKYAILAATLQKLKTSGELAATIETPGSRTQNTTDADIERYQQKADYYIEKYRLSTSYSFSSPVLHYGFSHHGGH